MNKNGVMAEIFGWAIPALVLFLLFALTVLGANELNRINCIRQSELLNMEMNYSIWTGCFVDTPEYGWFPLKNYILPAGIEP